MRRFRRPSLVAAGAAGAVGMHFPVEPLMALDPAAIDRLTQAFFFFDEEDEDEEDDCESSPVRVVCIDGCLVYRESWWWCSYEGIAHELQEAFDDPTCQAIVLRINSPGGLASGMTETVRRIREAKARAGKPVLAYVDELAASAAYGLAIVADEIWLPPSGTVGSVGTMLTVCDETKANALLGLRVEVLASGVQKTDGHPDVPLTNAALGRMRERMMTLNSLFVAQVADARRMTPEAVLALEAGVFLGQRALEVGLADRLAGLEETIAEAGRRGAAAAEARSAPAPAPSPFPLQGSSAPQPHETPMKSLLKALGLPETASEAEALVALSAHTEVQRELLTTTGKATAAEALGTLRGWKETASAHAELTTKLEADKVKLEADKATARSAAVEATLAMAVKTGRRTNAEAEAVRASIKTGSRVFNTDEQVAAFKAEIEASPVRYPGAPAGAGNPAGAVAQGGPQPPAEGSLVSKLWEQMKPMEKDALYRSNQAAYEALKADWVARGKPSAAPRR
jgi:ClpP class serine protease